MTSPALALGRPSFIGSSEFGGGTTSPFGQFWSKTGRLEQTPHNDIHDVIGGLMSNPDTAAQDPIFWLHHANIDRLWWLWEESHGNPSGPKWTAESFLIDGSPGFADEDGQPASLTCAEVHDTAGRLGYTYDGAARPPVPPAPEAPP